ncbi:MAG TPA: hypothetical protein DEE98_02910 [Elusimicrobia bacterium]|nr:MAG: hypothetical protein A2278_07740 [Elusimicrobia bacterium RIFOXYA12_FULL_49_49]OGS07238.1 MAG: hypothetical protein A2204_03975 [Elusimicrobia bacterium RIFOXYA1_FULL_47_7]OGS09408.1 MAG: hypothetical protein A2386_07970 [Elusimicrobia bacterium RIFOXYB1_FULL_48_9]OGS16044.1 MAG: hypothetical protein A2251_02525 [Elusimicrobia bacterium RIFOXYA2_FULL_47_53]OGS25785.1 MAG: hypothetical protein A2339_05110 [Elusimicrobia bacterium RIFOXYB12_FULL_50_12]OGS30204.1 MAG: hypothetical protein
MKKVFAVAALGASLLFTQNCSGVSLSRSRFSLSSDANFELVGVSPRVFSPDGELGTSNRVRFTFDNPGNAEVVVRIFDFSGNMVRRNIDWEDDNTMFWNGREANGNIAESGIYIYQIEADEIIINGTVVVAR